METTELSRAPNPDEEAGSYFAVDTHNDRWLVSVVMARHIERRLDRWPVPVWVSFVDLFGARIRIRAGLIQSLTQSTGEQRAASGELSRRLARERGQSEWDG